MGGDRGGDSQGGLIYPEILALAARKLETGEWSWNDGSRPADDLDRDLFMAILGAAAELGKHARAYDTLHAVIRHVGEPLGPWNNAKGRTLADVLLVLRQTGAPYLPTNYDGLDNGAGSYQLALDTLHARQETDAGADISARR